MNALILLLGVPLLWSGLAAGLRRLAARDQVLSDGAERLLLALMLLPVAAGLLVVAVPMPAPALTALPLPALTGSDGGASAMVAAIAPRIEPGPLVPWLILWTWLAGVAVAMARLGHAALVFGRAAGKAHALGDGVYETDDGVAAFAWRGRVVVPGSLRALLTEHQFRLIVAHERAHLRRRDPLWFLAFALIDALLWFNPFVTAQTAACRLAAELACDRAAAAGDGRTYARALLTALKLPHVAGILAPALSGKDGFRLRIDRIMTGRPAPQGMVWLCAAVLLAVPLTVVQFGFARGAPAPLAAVVPAAAPSPVASTLTMPTDGTVSERFGMRLHPQPGQPAFHQGIDIAAAMGTPVRAAAGGTVVSSGEQGNYGIVIELDHGDGQRTRYAHLSQASVRAGDSVTAGQTIGAVGSTGKSTGPHLHFELWRDGEAQDPAPLLGLPANPSS